MKKLVPILMSVHGADCKCDVINGNCTVLARSAEECAEVLNVSIAELERVAIAILSIEGIMGSKVKTGKYYLFFQRVHVTDL